jgi:curli production assembly/transport component CsgE
LLTIVNSTIIIRPIQLFLFQLVTPGESFLKTFSTLAMVCLAGITAACPAAAAVAAPAGVERGLAESYGGVVVNQTITVAGQEFFQYFVALWRERELSERFAITVIERPSARWGGQVWVEFAQRRVFQAPLSSARAGLRSLSEQAVDLVYQTVIDTEAERLLFRDADLGADEF